MDIIKVKESRRYIKTISKEHVNTLLIVGYSITMSREHLQTANSFVLNIFRDILKKTV